MDPSIFQPEAPGRLVPATAHERQFRNGVPEAVQIRCSAFVPDPLPPRVDRDAFVGRVSEELLAAQTGLARLDGIAGSLLNPDLLLRPFRLREAQLSSRIENTVASIEELVLVEADRAPERDEVQEVRNYLAALDHGLTSDLPLCNRLFREMHRILMDKVRGDEKRPGEFRTGQVVIGDERRGVAGARFVPPPGELVPECLAAYERFLNPDTGALVSRDRYPRLVEIAMAHYQFECIHPFNDGNGRLGRLIVAISMCRDGLLSRPMVYLSAFFDRHRQRYYDLLLRVSTHGDWEAWTRFFCEGVHAEAGDAARRAVHLRDLRSRYIADASAKRASALGQKLIDLLFVRPALRPAIVAAHLGVTTPTAQSHIDRLVERGIVEEVTGGKYGRVYVAREIIRAVEEELPGA